MPNHFDIAEQHCVVMRTFQTYFSNGAAMKSQRADRGGIRLLFKPLDGHVVKKTP